jgi:hypothetical protein
VAANAAGYGAVAPLLGAGSVRLGAGFLAATILAVAAVFLHTTLLDLDGDRRTHKHTTGVGLGAPAARRLALLLALGAAACAIRSAPPAIGVATGLLALLAGGATWGRPSSRSLCVAATAGYALAAASGWPAYGAAVAALALSTRFYYRRRFDLAYPAL